MNRQKEKAVALNVQLRFQGFNNNSNPHTDCLNGAGVDAVIIFFLRSCKHRKIYSGT